MSVAMLAESPVKNKSARFVPAVSEYDRGRELYKRGKRIEECVTDEMTQGYMDAEWAGYMAYSRHMEAEGVPAAQAFAFEGGW